MKKSFKWSEEPQKQPLFVITDWKEVARVEAKVKITFWTKILIILHLAEKPEKQYWIGAEIKVKEPNDLCPNDIILLHGRHESAWNYFGIVNGNHRISCMSPCPEMTGYIGPAVIVSNSFSEK